MRSDTLVAINFRLFQMASNCLSEVDFVYRQYRPHTIYQHPEESILSIDHWMDSVLISDTDVMYNSICSYFGGS